MEARKRPHTGFVSGDQTRYGKFTTPASSQAVRTVAPTPGTDLTTPGGVAAFDFVTGRNEFIRFIEQPITLGYMVEAKNPTYNPNSNEDANKVYWHRCNATEHPGAALNPNTGPSAFITAATVSLDSHVITEGIQMAGLSRVYKAFNTLTSVEAVRRAEGTHRLFKTDRDRRAGERTKSLNAASKLLYGTNAKDKSLTVVSTSLDGYPMLGRPRNHALNELDNGKHKDNKNCFIPPSTRVSVLLHLHENPEACIDWLDQTDVKYFKDANPKKEDGSKDELFVKARVTIQSIELSYESFVPEDDRMRARYEASTAGFHVDIPRLSTCYLNAGAQHCVNSVNVPEGSRLGYLAYCYSHAVWADSSSGRNTTTRFVFPGSITDVRVELADHGPVGVESTGKLTGTTANSSTALRNMVNHMRNNGLTSDEFDDIFPPKGGPSMSYLQALTLDLSIYKIPKPTMLTVSTTFSAADTCPRNLYLVSCFVQEGQLKRTAGRSWKLEPVRIAA